MWAPVATGRLAPTTAGHALRGASRSVGQAPPPRCRRARPHVNTTTRATGGPPPDMGGGRDPTQQELEFGFQERVLYHGDTEHIRMIPSKARQFISLAGRKCTPCAADATALAYKDAELLRKQVLDWKLVEQDGGLLLRRVWRAKDAASASELAARITALATSEGHSARCAVSDDNSVTVELSTQQVRGVSENDFIVAAKTDALSLADLIPATKKKTYFF